MPPRTLAGREGGKEEKIPNPFSHFGDIADYPSEEQSPPPSLPNMERSVRRKEGGGEGGKRALFVLSEIWMARSSVSCTYVV